MFNGLAKQMGSRQAKVLNEQYVSQVTDFNVSIPKCNIESEIQKSNFQRACRKDGFNNTKIILVCHKVFHKIR